MKPIHLQIAGLQSYRETQQIDFTALCGAGVFGIFGPTGSGKSSILDAMTLALFGSVERAAGGTQGIMNQAENVLSVSFTFQLQNAAGVQTYRVDRQFKRSGETSVNNTLSRIVQMEAQGPVVLADKAKDVTAQVQNILGLSMQDFTRAVVLPQGKFAEFLTLTGKDRRMMLQRLFHLENYGDQLSAKVASMYKEKDVAVKEIAAEQLGLGDASEEALASAKARWRAAEGGAEEVRVRLAAQEKHVEQSKQLKLWQEESEETLKRLTDADAKTPQVEELKRRLAFAERAEKARPYLEQQEYAERQVAERGEALRRETEAEAAAQNVFAHAQSGQLAADQSLAEHEAPLSVKISRLEQALQLEQELEADVLAERQHEEQALAQETELQTAKGSLLKETELRDKAVVRQAELKDQLKQAEVTADVRQSAQEAVQQQRELTRLEQELTAQDAELARQKDQLEANEVCSRQLREERSGLQERLADWQASCTEAAVQAQRLISGLDGLLAAAPALAEQLREADRAASLHRMAAELARGLQHGEPCPVCGACEHPLPAALPAAPAAAEAHEPLRELDALQAQARGALAGAQQLRYRLSGLLQQAAAAGAPAPGASGAAAGLAAQLDAAQREAAPAAEGDGVSVGAFRRQLQEAEDAASALSAQAAGLEPGLHGLLREAAQLDGALRDLQAAAQPLAAFAEGAAQKRAALADALAQRRDAWRAAFPQLAPEQAAQRLAELRGKDEQAEELRRRIDKSVPYIEERLAAIERQQRQAAALELALVERRAQLAAAQSRLAEKRRQLAALTGGERAAAQIAAATAQLAELRSAAAAAKLALDRAREAAQAAARVKAAAQQACASAEQLAAKAQSEWRQALAAAGFAGAQELRERLLPAADKAAWAAEAEAHDSALAQLKGKLAELQGKLQGRSIGADEWAELEAQLAGLREANEQALQLKAKAERDYEDLTAKHGRWNELEVRRLDYQTVLERLSKLQTVLRGNAFVEFVAEEQLMQVSRAASERLSVLTRGKYAIEVDSGGGFVIRDNAGGGVRRPVSTLSGGETFLTSLALALALSAQIQLKGQYPLEFFFLDEGFGTLDQELLETVIAALEKLHMDNLTVGVISHVPELKTRLPRRLIVDPAEPGGRGSRVRIETF
ncbi:AAA family ATPase [Paenibacillus thalictri]|uniref:Nuclease SbcCD subunit C n=1 Tax=Paenibacillus thalictri TaxID=2527873 RepID=A0A4Q9DHJ8_9BACL|nr:SMC family ATPase [Paenibacillus thalictri]TBL70384.1 SMC family ATPase [Paenibacillus thalictri]